MNRVLVVGASGNVGGEVVSQLTATGAFVRAMLRRPDGVRLPEGVEAKPGDLTMPETLDACLDGIDAVFLVWVAPAGTIEPALERIARQAKRLVLLTAPLKTPHPFFQQPNPARTVAAEVEQTVERSGLEWTFVRAGIFAGNARNWWGAPIRSGEVVRWPCLDVATAPIHQRDIAAVAVRALTEEGHGGAEYVITGPEELTQREQLSILGSAIGRTLPVEEIPLHEARSVGFGGMPPRITNMLLDAWVAAAGRPAWVTSTVEQVTGAPALKFDVWARENAVAFRS